MGRYLEQNASGNVVIGPIVTTNNVLLSALAIANNQIVLIKEGSVSASRSDTTSAVSVGPGMYRIGLNATDTNTMGTLLVYVSASAAIQYAERAEVIQSGTYKLFYGSADQIATSAGVSAIVSVVVNGAITNADLATSADVSAIVSVVTQNAINLSDLASSADVSAIVSVVASLVAGRALTNYDVPTSADVSSIVGVIVSGQSAQYSTIFQNALVNYDVPTSADVSAIVVGVLTGYDVPTSADISAIASVVGQNVLTSYDVPTSADVSTLLTNVVQGLLLAFSANVSTVVNGALVNYDVPNSADVSAIVAAAGGVGSAAASVIVAGVLANYDVPTSGDVSAIVSGLIQQALVNYDVPTSADISAIVAPAVWNVLGTEPTTAVQWHSAPRGVAFDWILARSLNKHTQTATTIEILSSAGAVIASASVSNNSVSATRDQFRG